MDKKIWLWAVLFVMLLPVANAITVEKVLLQDTFNADSTHPLSERWGVTWVSNDNPNYTHFSIQSDPLNAPNGVLRIQYGYAESNGASTITFANGTYVSGNIVEKTYNGYSYLKESVDIYRPDSYSNRFSIYFMSSPDSYLNVVKYATSEEILIYYKDTSGTIKSINTNTNAPVGKWFRITAETTQKVTITIMDMSTNSVIYTKDLTDIKIEDLKYRLAFTRDDTNDGHYIYIDNAIISTIEEAEESPIPKNPLGEALSGSWVYMLVFITVIIFLSLAFIYDHWATVLIVLITSFILFSMFLLPYFDISGTTSLYLSGGIAVALTLIKYYSIRDKVSDIFSRKETGTILLILGIIALLVLLFLT